MVFREVVSIGVEMRLALAGYFAKVEIESLMCYFDLCSLSSQLGVRLDFVDDSNKRISPTIRE